VKRLRDQPGVLLVAIVLSAILLYAALQVTLGIVNAVYGHAEQTHKVMRLI